MRKNGGGSGGKFILFGVYWELNFYTAGVGRFPHGLIFFIGMKGHGCEFVTTRTVLPAYH
jgi:hypothetical protein